MLTLQIRLDGADHAQNMLNVTCLGTTLLKHQQQLSYMQRHPSLKGELLNIEFLKTDMLSS